MKKEYRGYPEEKRGSAREGTLSQMEWIEYHQTGMVKIKETPISRGELGRSHYSGGITYYDWMNPANRAWLEEMDFL